MKTLHFIHAGTSYACSLEPETLGHVTRYGEHTWKLPHGSWVILGVSRRWNQKCIPVPLTPGIDPKTLIGGYAWDRDHGTIRTWGGQYRGKLPRISSAWITEGKETDR